MTSQITKMVCRLCKKETELNEMFKYRVEVEPVEGSSDTMGLTVDEYTLWRWCTDKILDYALVEYHEEVS